MADVPQKENTLLQGRYRIVKRLGQGGMGTVYEAVDERLDTSVAIKETHFKDERLGRQFENEARLLARLRHPALTKVNDHFMEAGGQFLVMEFIPGRDLWEMLQDRNAPFTPVEVLPWADQLLDALVYLHGLNPPVVHRDIKPQNLKLTDENRIILLDFGLAKGYRGGGDPSQMPTQSVLGATAAYAPLEQILQVDQTLCDALAMQHPDKVKQIFQNGTGPRSDLYSLGATLIHLLTGKKPIPAAVRAMSVWPGRPDPLHELLHGQLSAPLVELLQRATALNADERHSSAGEMRTSLQELKAGLVHATKGQEPTLIDAPPRPTVHHGEAGPAQRPGLVSTVVEQIETPAPKGTWRKWMRALVSKIFSKETAAAWITAAATIIAGVLSAIILWGLPYIYAPPPVDKEVEYAGQVVNSAGHPINGATVNIRDEKGNVQVKRTDSVGRYQYFLKPSTRSAHFTVTADNYLPYERDLSPNQTGREAFILTPGPPTPSVTPNPSPSVAPTPEATPSPQVSPTVKPKSQSKPCSPRDMLLGKC